MARKFSFGLVLIVGVAYFAALVALAVSQRQMMYFPAPASGDAGKSGLSHAATLRLRTPDGQSVVAWYQAPTDSARPLYLFFHGNGGNLGDRARLLGDLAEDGSGFLAIDYRGYGGSTGTPSEAGIILDGTAAYDEVRRLGYAADRIVVVGESLGSGVAVAVAATHEIHALVLDSAFSAAVDVAATDYPLVPVHMLMQDQFRSYERIPGVAAPKLFLYGDKDGVISRASARKLFDAARDPKTWIEIPDLGHVVLLEPEVLARMKHWLAALPQS